MEFKKKRKKNIHLDMTPIVDIVFILLIFFALSLNFSSTTSLGIKLPEISSSQNTTGYTYTKVQIRKTGEIFINDTITSHASLYGVLVNKRLKNPQSNIIIQADENITHGKVVNLIAICKKSGFNRISIAAHIKNPDH